jgi:hypothetical protein
LTLVLLVFGAAIAAVTAGWSPARVLGAVACLLVIASTARFAFALARSVRQSSRSTLALGSAGGVALVILILIFLHWPLGKSRATAPAPAAALVSSCSPSALQNPPAISPAQAASPLMYKVVSTDTQADDHTAVSHQLYGHGWIQQVFLATADSVAEVSAIIDAQVPPRGPLSVIFQIRTMQGQVLGTIHAAYDGSANNRDFGNFFRRPVPLSKGHLYVLRVINNNPQAVIAIYTHYLDSAQTVPYHIAACEYDSFDGPGRAFPMQDNRGEQVLSGFIQVPGA